MQQVFHLLYTSRSQDKITNTLLQSILLSARRHNSIDQLTGFLIVRNGYFMQLLEGDEAKVRQCYKRIELDPRHADIVIRAEFESAMRVTPSWSMGYVPWNDHMESSKDLINFFENEQNKAIDEEMDFLIEILQKFAKEAKNVA